MENCCHGIIVKDDGRFVKFVSNRKAGKISLDVAECPGGKGAGLFCHFVTKERRMSGKININQADAATLAELPGIGHELAQRIVEYREEEHPFEDVFDLVEVPGISVRMVRAFEAEVTVGEGEAATAVSPPEEPADEAEIAAEESDAAAVPEPAEEPVSEAEMTDEEPQDAAVGESPAKPDDAVTSAIRVAQPDEAEAMNDEPEEPSQPVPPVTAVSPPTNQEWERRAQRRGCFSVIAGAVFGAVLGAALTLAILAGVNQGSLTYSEADAAILQQLQAESQTRSAALESVAGQIDAAATMEAAANRSLSENLGAVATRAGQNRLDVTRLDGTIEAVDERVSEIAGAAETFNTFLLGLREVILTLEPDLPITPTVTATATATQARASRTPRPSATSDQETTPTNTATARPTRTPRPTSTPLPFPTRTPAPQP